MKRMVVWVMSALLALTCINLSQPSAIAAENNLVVNGSFEKPDTQRVYYENKESNKGFLLTTSIEGWESDKTLGIELSGKNIRKAYEGSQSVELDSYEVTSLFQDVPTKAGKTYKLSFAFSPTPGTQDNQLKVRWGKTAIAKLSKDGTSLTEPKWQVYTYNVQANSNSTRLSFDNLDETSDGFGSLLDDVKLEPSGCQLQSNCSVVLLPDQTVSVPIKIQIPQSAGTLPLDLMLTQDLTGSYKDDLPVLKKLIPDFVQQLRSLQPDTTFGVATFTDKTGTSDNYVYKTKLPLSKNANAFKQAVTQLATSTGGDTPESSLSALFQVAVRANSELGFRQDTRRVAIVATDAPYHKAGDFSGTPNNGDAVLDANEDYPSVAQVSEAVKRANLLPVFLVTSDVQAVYKDLVNQLGVGGAVVPLSSDSSNLVAALKEGLEVANQNLTVAVLDDTYNYVNSVTPERFSDVAPGSEVTTTINFKYSGKGSGENVTVRAIGLGDLVIDVIVAL